MNKNNRWRRKEYIRLMRPKHCLKNALVLVPVFFDLQLFDNESLMKGICGFFIFSLLSSMIYIINDLNDIESDKKSIDKNKRPLAAGTVSIKEAKVMLAVLFACIGLLLVLTGVGGILWLLLYFVLNIAYSMKFKHVAIIDVVILASGFLIRLLYGASITGIDISFWLCMTVVSFSFFMGLGKRRNELAARGKEAHEIRGVLKYYNIGFFDKNMYMCLGLAIAFYALWSGNTETIEKFGTSMQMWTVPIVIILAMKYSLDIEKGESADPIEIITNDRYLLMIAVVYVCIMILILYL